MSLANLLVESIPQTLRPFAIIAMAVGVVCLFMVNVFLADSHSKSLNEAGPPLGDQSPSRVPVERGAPGRRF